MKTLIIAPHADDETLGCGGTILRKIDEGEIVGWLLITNIVNDKNVDVGRIKTRQEEILKVVNELGINKKNFFSLDFEPTKLDEVPFSFLVTKISNVINTFKPEEIFIPYAHDVHSDHRIVFKASVASSKSFRHSYVKTILSYETPSETDFIIDPEFKFYPNVFIDISKYIDRKLDIMFNYKSEFDDFPFPRSKDSVQSLAKVRGSQAGFDAAEAFQLLKQRY